MAITNQTKRAVMTMAWGLFREAQEGEEPRTFAVRCRAPGHG